MIDNNLRLVFWELTARCNLKCRHCRAEAQDNSVEGELSTEEIIRVASDIRETGNPIIILTGGEPLIRKDFFNIAETCVGMFSRVALATNGTLVDDELASRIANCGIQRVSISLDGSNAETHDAFRGMQGSFHNALDGFNALKKAGASVQVNSTVTRHNVDQLQELLDLTESLGADAFHVFVLVPVGCGVEISDDARLAPDQIEDTLHWLFDKSLELKNKLHIKATCAPQYYRIMREVSKDRGLPLEQKGHGMQAMTRGCLAGSAVCFISRIGDVQPCGYLPIQAGNVREQKFSEIWADNEVFNSLRNPASLKGKCHSCEYRKLCAGCRARAFADTTDFLAEDPDCLYIPA